MGQITIDRKIYTILAKAAEEQLNRTPKTSAEWLPLAVALNKCPHVNLTETMLERNVPYRMCKDCGAILY